MSLSGDLVIFIDAENASAKWGVPLYVWLCQNFKVRECYCVGNRATVAKDYLLLEGPKFHLVNSMLGKDSADTWLVMLGSRELCLRRSVKKVAILSNDRDFAPLAYLAAERQKKLIIYAAGNSGTEGLKQAIKRTEAGEAASVEVIELDKLRLILGLASDGEFVEIPFVDGMQESTFVELLIAYKVVKDGKVEASFYHSLGLTRRQKAVYYDREELEVEAEAKGKEHVSA